MNEKFDQESRSHEELFRELREGLMETLNVNILEVQQTVDGLVGLPKQLDKRMEFVVTETQTWALRCCQVSERVRETVLTGQRGSNGFTYSQIERIKDAICEQLRVEVAKVVAGVSDVSGIITRRADAAEKEISKTYELITRRADTSENILNHLQRSIFNDGDGIKSNQCALMQRIIRQHDYNEVSLLEIKRYLVCIQRNT
jgi:hypothetical protein